MFIRWKTRLVHTRPPPRHYSSRRRLAAVPFTLAEVLPSPAWIWKLILHIHRDFARFPTITKLIHSVKRIPT